MLGSNVPSLCEAEFKVNGKSGEGATFAIEHELVKYTNARMKRTVTSHRNSIKIETRDICHVEEFVDEQVCQHAPRECSMVFC